MDIIFNPPTELQSWRFRTLGQFTCLYLNGSFLSFWNIQWIVISCCRSKDKNGVPPQLVPPPIYLYYFWGFHANLLNILGVLCLNGIYMPSVETKDSVYGKAGAQMRRTQEQNPTSSRTRSWGIWGWSSPRWSSAYTRRWKACKRKVSCLYQRNTRKIVAFVFNLKPCSHTLNTPA